MFVVCQVLLVEGGDMETERTCDGTESSLLNCSFDSSGIGIDCGQLKDAHVVCQGM